MSQVKDTEGVTIYQRKNQLNRRLREERNRLALPSSTTINRIYIKCIYPPPSLRYIRTAALPLKHLAFVSFAIKAKLALIRYVYAYDG